MTLAERLDELAEGLEEAFGDWGCSLTRALDELTLDVPRERLHELMTRLQREAPFEFEQCIDICGIDYSAYGQAEWTAGSRSTSGFSRGVDRRAAQAGEPEDRFGVVYHLQSVARNHRLRVRTRLDADEPIVASVVDIWSSANWFEREAFDLFGILFDGHPDLRRILTDYGFIGHPFRKDFPLEGHVEMRYDPEQKRVVYEPVKLDPRVLVPRTLREDARYEQGRMAATEESEAND